MYKRIATSTRSATSALLGENKITATTRMPREQEVPFHIIWMVHGCYGCYMNEIYLTLHNRRHRRHRRDRLTSLYAIFSAAKVPRHDAPRAAHASTSGRPALAHFAPCLYGKWCRGAASSACTHPSLAATGSKLWYGETGGGYSRGPMKVTPGNTHRQRNSVAGREPVQHNQLSLTWTP